MSNLLTNEDESFVSSFVSGVGSGSGSLSNGLFFKLSYVVVLDIGFSLMVCNVLVSRKVLPKGLLSSPLKEP